MNQAYLSPQGDPVTPEDIALPKAREVVRFLGSELNPFARLVECRAGADEEVVVLEVEVELPQRPVNDIRRHERLEVVFYRDDGIQPEVLDLRPDFPLVPHLNQRAREFPRSLCLYDRPYNEIKIDSTAAAFLERIRYWLAQTAKGELHAPDQPLEPLLFEPVTDLVLPSDVLGKESSGAPTWLAVRAIQNGPERYTVVATRMNGSVPKNKLDWVAVVLTCLPQPHGILRSTPRTIRDLHDFTVAGGLDLIGTLRQALKGWIQEKSGSVFSRLLDARPILVVRLPKIREAGGDVETVEFRAFATGSTISRVGVDIGVWQLNEDKPGLLLEHDEAKRGADTSLAPLNPRPAFSRVAAAQANGLTEAVPVKVVAMGVGALGSQVVTNLIRAGFGQWTLIDEDVLLPHNLGRHALDGSAVGRPKASALAAVLNAIIEDNNVARAIVANALRPGEEAEALQSAFLEAEVILDMSASVPVARHLCRDVESTGRRVSLFLNPTGTALTLLAEDAGRRIPLDNLEMQSYREIAGNPELKGLLQMPDRVRTGQSCRDLSVPIPQDLVAVLGGIGSRAFRETTTSDRARISIWRVDPKEYTVGVVHVEPAKPMVQQLGDWTLVTDAQLLGKLADLREERLPKETGGVLLGAYDVSRKIIYVVDTVPSPPDSEEWPTVYIRGVKGLKQRVREIGDATHDMLRYVGEWHSHPRGSSVSPSPDDLKVSIWVGELMDLEGVPGVMAIVGEEGRLSLHLSGQAAA